MPGFFAYPSHPNELANTIDDGASRVFDLSTWKESDVAGHFIATTILDDIANATYFVADITYLNFNVFYEIGYAIGRQRPIRLVRYSPYIQQNDVIQEIGLFDTIGYDLYSDSVTLAEKVRPHGAMTPILIPVEIRTSSPVYVVLPKERTNYETRITSCIKKARLQYRSFDPIETYRLPVREAISSVASSHGVVIPLVPPDRNDALVHNHRAAFVAGLARGLEKEVLLLQAGDGPVPLDYRDLVSWVRNLDSIVPYVHDFASDVTYRLQSTSPSVNRARPTFLASLNIGSSSAENEMQELGEYFLETDEYLRAARGEGHVIAGRKGSGKTALFVQLRDKLRRNRQTIVLDLKPEGFQLLKFKDVILQRLQQGTKEHTVTAFWEYLLLLETCHKILEKDREPHTRNHKLYDQYRSLSDAYGADQFVAEADFAERILKLTQRIASDFEDALGDDQDKQSFTQKELTTILYKHDVAKLRAQVCKYLQLKNGLWILFDNIDKGWPAHGLQPDDVTILRCLLDAISKLEKYLRHHDHEVDCHGMVFIRNDVYELLLSSLPDRGKLARITIDWSDPDLLRELLRCRLVANEAPDTSFEAIWPQICVSHIEANESSTYLIDRCLMRPRCLIDLMKCCISHAVNLNHQKIEIEDIRHGEETFSTDLILNIGFEMRDVYPNINPDILYCFVESPSLLTRKQVLESLKSSASLDDEAALSVFELLLWNGFLGVVRSNEEITYIYTVRYDRHRLKAIVSRVGDDQPSFHINPAFWAGLEVKPSRH